MSKLRLFIRTNVRVFTLLLLLMGYFSGNIRAQSLALPSNIKTSKDLQLLLVKIWKNSDTFRGQCEKIAAAPQAHIEIKIMPNIGCRALSSIKKSNGQLEITIQLAPMSPNLYVELIGHEFEHILEQLEGIDLRSLANKPKSRVYRLYNGSFETDRAVQAGQTIAYEYEWHKPEMVAQLP